MACAVLCVGWCVTAGAAVVGQAEGIKNNHNLLSLELGFNPMGVTTRPHAPRSREEDEDDVC